MGTAYYFSHFDLQEQTHCCRAIFFKQYILPGSEFDLRAGWSSALFL